MNEAEIEDLAKFLRLRSQVAGISNHESWDKISEPRKNQWRRMAEAFDGYTIIPTSLLESGMKVLEEGTVAINLATEFLQKLSPK